MQRKNIREVKTIEETLRKNSNILFAYLFGSFVSGITHKESDIDVAVYLKPDSIQSYLKDEKEIIGELTFELQTDRVDLVILNTAQLILKYRIISKGRLIFSIDEITRIKFEVSVLENYFELKPYFDEADYLIMKRIKTGA